MEQKHNNIPLGMMTTIGKRNKEAASEVKKWILEALKHAGVTEILTRSGEREIRFMITTGNEMETAIPIDYTLIILSGDGTIRLEQETGAIERNEAKNVLTWFIQRRNMDLKRMNMNAEYVRKDGRIILESVIKIRDRNCRQLIGKISRMNRVAEEDYNLLKFLKKGIVTKDVASQIENEYAKYKEEWEEYVNI